MEIALCAVVVLILILLGTPVAFSFLSGSLLYAALEGVSPLFIAPTAFHNLDVYALLAVPLFMLAGTLTDEAGIANRLVEFASALLAKVKGGMGATIVVSCMFFGAMSGSGIAEAAALGAILIPRMERLGWSRRYTSACLAAAQNLGFMIPPNMTAILFGVISGLSVGALFLATIVPGILWGLALILVNQLVYKKWYHPVENQKKVSEGYWRNLKKTSLPSVPAFFMPVIILGGIYSGVFTPTEAGAVACLYAIVAGIVFYREIRLKNGFGTFIKTAKNLGSLLIIFPLVMGFTRILIQEGVPQAIATWLTNITDNKYLILLLFNIIFIISGMFLNQGVLILVLTPILMPTVVNLGVNPYHMATVIMTNVGIGTFTPPMALGLFVVSRVGGVSVNDMLKPLWPFIFISVPVLFIITYFPWLSLWLPKLIMGEVIGPIGW